jgi:glycosyltransferase involved in cell wall biosynthesis
LVTVLIPCRNAAESIVACVESVRDMADEILIADTGSTDDTVRLVRSMGDCRIVQRQSADEAALESWAASHARHPWIFRILPGERLNSELARQVQDTIATEPAEDGFRVIRSIYFRGHLLKHGGFQRESSLRLYRKGRARYEVHNGRVEVTVDPNETGRLASRLEYEVCFDIDGHLREMMRVAGRIAADNRRNQRRPTRWRAIGLAAWQLLHSYILRFGFLDGWAGLHACCLSAFAIYLREAMLWEMNEPALARRTVMRDHWQELKVFDPNTSTGATDQVNVAQFAEPVEAAPADPAPRQMRPAA